MAPKPKKQDYEPTDADKANASVALAEYNYFKQNYQPLLVEQAAESLTDNTKAVLRGRAGADVAQAISAPNVNLATNMTDYASDYAKALGGQVSLANTTANDLKNKHQISVLSAARKQQGVGQRGLSEAARMSTDAALATARAKQEAKMASFGMATQLASAFGQAGMKNLAGTGKFFGGKMSLSDRLKWGVGGEIPGSNDTEPDVPGLKVDAYGNTQNLNTGLRGQIIRLG